MIDGAIPHGDFSQNKKLTMKISLYSANSPNNFFKKDWIQIL